MMAAGAWGCQVARKLSHTVWYLLWQCSMSFEELEGVVGNVRAYLRLRNCRVRATWVHACVWVAQGPAQGVVVEVTRGVPMHPCTETRMRVIALECQPGAAIAKLMWG